MSIIWTDSLTFLKTGTAPEPNREKRRNVRRLVSAILSTGYDTSDLAWYRMWNVGVASLALLFLFPLFAAVSVAILLTSGRPVFYAGHRLGKDKKSFKVYKFRTLKSQAAELTRQQVLPKHSAMETRLGKPLRDTRLDEMPQLINVLRGDMNLFGPRPVRPEIAETCSAGINNYDARFSVKPGIIGHTQVFTTHGAPKRLRSYYNAKLIKRRAYFWKEMVILSSIGLFALVKCALILVKKLEPAAGRRRQPDLRNSRRVKLREANAQLSSSAHDFVYRAEMLDMNDEAFKISSIQKIPEGEYQFALNIRLPMSGKTKRARCVGDIKESPAANGAAASDDRSMSRMGRQNYVVHFQAASPLNAYIMEKYFLKEAFISLA